MAIDPKLVSIKTAGELPVSDPSENANFLFYEGETLQTSPMSNIYDKVSSGLLPATTTTVPEATGFHRYLVHTAGTYTNFNGIVVTAADLDIVNGVANNRVILEVSEGVATKRVERVKGDKGEAADMGFNNLEGATFVAALGTPIISTQNDTTYIKFNALTSEAIKAENVLIVGTSYYVAFKVRVSTYNTAIKITVGSQYSATPSINCVQSDNITDFANSKWRILEFTANTPDFFLGKIPLNVGGYTLAVDDIIVIEKVGVKDAILDNIISKYIESDRIIAIEDEVLNAEFGWKNTVGTAASVDSGKLKFNFTTGNQCASLTYLSSLLLTGIKLNVSFKAKMITGTGLTKIIVGRFAGSANPVTFHFKVTPTLTEQTYSGDIYIEDAIPGTPTAFSVGALSADNNGGSYEIYDIKITEAAEDGIIPNKYENIIYNNTGGVFPNVNPSNPHNEIKIIGDSLSANAIGIYPIPNVESLESQRPFRMTYRYNYPRQIYNKYCQNKPKWRRLDDAAWTKTGVWDNVNDSTLFEPVHSLDKYFRTTTAGATAELAIPDGDEYLMIIIKEANGYGTLNFLINGTAPTQGLSYYNCNYINVGHTGNPYKKLLFKLPVGTGRTFRITKDATANQVMVWGAYSWAGSTTVFTPIAHGGHTLAQLQDQHYQDEYVRNKDITNGVIFQVTEMNDMTTLSINAVLSNLNKWYENLKDKDVLFTTCNILGTDPTDGTPNYYITTQTNGFTQKQMNNAVKKFIIDAGIPFIDLFTIYERATISRGGSIENGDAGLFWTHDGQHGSTEGVSLWFQSLTPALNTMPIYALDK